MLSSLDPFPTCLLKRCIDEPNHPITPIINISMQDGVVPDDIKQTLVNNLKKHKLSKNELNNYRLISNLRFISNVLEKE